MPENFEYVSVEFGNQVRLYLAHFELIEADLAKLISFSSNDISEIINGEKGVVLITAEKISRVFGLSYYEMGNPKKALPSFQSLPKITQDTILKRKDIGVPSRNYDSDFVSKLDEIIAGNFLNVPKTAKEIWQQLPESIRKDAGSPVRITDLLRRSPRNEKVVMVGKKGREHLFQLANKA